VVRRGGRRASPGTRDLRGQRVRFASSSLSRWRAVPWTPPRRLALTFGSEAALERAAGGGGGAGVGGRGGARAQGDLCGVFEEGRRGGGERSRDEREGCECVLFGAPTRALLSRRRVVHRAHPVTRHPDHGVAGGGGERDDVPAAASTPPSSLCCCVAAARQVGKEGTRSLPGRSRAVCVCCDETIVEWYHTRVVYVVGGE
jgi:hypothetical protein